MLHFYRLFMSTLDFVFDDLLMFKPYAYVFIQFLQFNLITVLFCIC